jgi:hypothetical protein
LLVYIYEDNAGSSKQTPDNPLMTIKMAKGSTGVTYVKSGSYVDIVLDLAAAGKTINLDAGKDIGYLFYLKLVMLMDLIDGRGLKQLIKNIAEKHN